MLDVLVHISYGHFLVLAAILFAIGAVGVMVRRNALIVMMAIELMLNAANMTLLTFARMHQDMGGHSFAFVVIAIAAAEAAIGLAIVVAVYRARGHADVDRLGALKH
ncbi:NADH-ubiquinone oxidoreductase chain 4L [Haliangium ochraceum DSM 14365]|uniref:NADH-quinone oxidoreductase subunit K n=1 Tax=Haliangium ochraceum (strain DSM 14365 / JCM 11303 / SMP-2) TaxID=502025 RepID=D0LZ04_HALO1|nr:NADH-quinone oxidoreductase subunit NuoK [Haliangium ochraceum]ACY14474.1 NADH-ubiquinone oxidoreductase chain 4L [Haliangium ochraceum DSM 14365]